MQNGPSPRTWGERHKSDEYRSAIRTIPTHVGRTKRHSTAAIRCNGPSPRTWGEPQGVLGRNAGDSDHPHARGENVSDSKCKFILTGPSPRTWGERVGALSRRFAHRTIPTHVGRTPQHRPGRSPITDHPHARGENDWSEATFRCLNGPSPRTWGEHLPPEKPQGLIRTIPTHVGRTYVAPIWSCQYPDHPHARGENSGFQRT